MEQVSPSLLVVDGDAPGGAEAAAVPADDRGLAYGDGLFETIAVAGGQPRLLGFHLDRLADGAARLSLPLPRAAVASAIDRHAALLGDGVVKYLITRGSGPRGYAPPSNPSPRHVLFRSRRPAGFADRWWHENAPVDVVLCATPLGANPALAGLKHLNRLEQVLARAEWQDPAIAEGLMRVYGGDFVCATAANLFALRADRLVTPPLVEAGVAGVMRRAVLEAADASGLTVVHRALDEPTLRGGADAVLLSSALTGLRRVGRLGPTPLPEPVGGPAQRLLRLRERLARALGVTRP